MIRNLAALGLPLCLAAPAAAQSVQAKQFGAREMIRDVSVSPDGQRVQWWWQPETGGWASSSPAPMDS